MKLLELCTTSHEFWSRYYLLILTHHLQVILKLPKLQEPKPKLDIKNSKFYQSDSLNSTVTCKNHSCLPLRPCLWPLLLLLLLQSQYFGSIFTALQEEHLSIFRAKQSHRLTLLDPEDGGYTFLWHIVNIQEDMNLINICVRMSIKKFINSINTLVQWNWASSCEQLY